MSTTGIYNFYALFFCGNVTCKRSVCQFFSINHKYFRIMKSDNEEDSNMNLVMELEEATEMVDEV